MTNQVPVTFVDNPHAPDVFVDAPSGIAFISGVIRLTFESARMDHGSPQGQISRVVIGRLVLPLSGAEALRDLLTDYIGKLKARGTAPQAPGH